MIECCPAGVAMVGVSYHRAPIGLLERLTLPQAAQPAMLAELAARGCGEAVVVSTAGRTEIYTTIPGNNPAAEIDHDDWAVTVTAILAARCGVSTADTAAVVHARDGEGAARHLRRVAAGLDSRVLYDADIAGQLAAAAADSDRAGMLGPELGALFAAAADTAVTTDSCITRRSAPAWAVDVGSVPLRRSGSTVPARVLVLGEGPARDALQARLTEHGLAARTVTTLPPGPVEADLVICIGPAGAHWAITADHTRGVQVNAPLTIVDLCLPRAADPALADVPGVRLLDLDDLDDDPETRHRLGLATERALARLLAGPAPTDQAGQAGRHSDTRLRSSTPAAQAEERSWAL